jgi:glycosyltransferase involved in cell wall biosynthesis
MTRSVEPFTILIVNYRTQILTRLCMSLLKKHVDLSRNDVVVVDNGSNDGSLAYLRSLNWIKLVEREQGIDEPAFISHGQALDEGIKHCKTEYVCLIHTDTFIYDAQVFDMLLGEVSIEGVAAAGTKNQRHRKAYRKMLRTAKKATRYFFQSILLDLGLTNKGPKPYKDGHLKSFCCMWDANLIKKHELKFSTGSMNPGYEMQNTLTELGYKFVDVGTRALFNYLSHVQSGTVVEINEEKKNVRRNLEYQKIVKETMSTL